MNKNEIMSPCVSVCRLDADEVCEGCGRTLKEIREWLIYSDESRIAIMRRLAA
jgi:predicted Fe-S protein YdhL (DUF1289 family)